MTVTNEEFQMMVEDMTTDLISLVIERDGLSIPQAFEKVYSSHIYEALQNPESQLYFQSPGYVYSCLNNTKESSPKVSLHTHY